jgi:hypothetical protein
MHGNRSSSRKGSWLLQNPVFDLKTALEEPNRTKKAGKLGNFGHLAAIASRF